MRMDARRATKVVVEPTKPRSATTQTPHFAATRRDGAFRAVCFVARLVKGVNHSLRLASRIPSRKAAVATARGLIRGSLSAGATSCAPRKCCSSTASAPLPASRCASPSPGRTLSHFGVARRLFGTTKLRGSRLELSPKSPPSHT